MGWSQLVANLTLSYSLPPPPQQDRGRRGKSRNEKHFRSIWNQKDHLISLSAKQTLFVKNKFIVNENKYGITYLGIRRKRTINQMFTCLKKTALLPFFPYSTSSQIPLSSLLLPQVTLHPYSEPMHHMRLGNVCVYVRVTVSTQWFPPAIPYFSLFFSALVQVLRTTAEEKST